jgi:ATP-dependent Clp protease protease subunit
MPIGVPRILYCWGEELPAQWTDIYNFIFRRRMVFLMQYLDDELCNQICGLLINIHMEDRSKEFEKKEMENSGFFSSKTGTSNQNPISSTPSSQMWQGGQSKLGTKKEKSIEDLMISEEDLAIDENYMLERHTLQKISLDQIGLNWTETAQFFDYTDEPYLFYLAELFGSTKENGQSLYDFQNKSGGKNLADLEKLMLMFQNMQKNSLNNTSVPSQQNPYDWQGSSFSTNKAFEVYSAFRLLSNFTMQKKKDYLESGLMMNKLLENQNGLLLDNLQNHSAKNQSPSSSLIFNYAKKDLLAMLNSPLKQTEKALAQRQLRRAYSKENRTILNQSFAGDSSFLNQTLTNRDEAYMEYRDYYRKQTERTLQEEESKKVFMIINSFGGSVGNGITVHDALQFIKAGSMTLALGVAASAASLALAGGTIGERYVTEGCHVMIHQPESAISGQASDIWIDSQEIMKIRLDVAEIYSLSTYRPRHKILKDMDRDCYLNATETVYYGLADEIATNEVLSDIIASTNKIWDYHEGQQQRLLEARDSASSGFDTQTSS